MYASGVIRECARNVRWKCPSLTPSACASGATAGELSPASISLHASTTKWAFLLANSLSWGRHHRHGRKPALFASETHPNQSMFSGRGGREMQVTLQ